MTPHELELRLPTAKSKPKKRGLSPPSLAFIPASQQPVPAAFVGISDHVGLAEPLPRLAVQAPLNDVLVSTFKILFHPDESRAIGLAVVALLIEVLVVHPSARHSGVSGFNLAP